MYLFLIFVGLGSIYLIPRNPPGVSWPCGPSAGDAPERTGGTGSPAHHRLPLAAGSGVRYRAPRYADAAWGRGPCLAAEGGPGLGTRPGRIPGHGSARGGAADTGGAGDRCGAEPRLWRPGLLCLGEASGPIPPGPWGEVDAPHET